MKCHLGWIRFAAATAIVIGYHGTQAAAQYAPYRPMPQAPVQTAAPATPVIAQQQTAAPIAPAGQPAYAPYRPQAAQPIAATPYRTPAVATYPQTSGYPQATAYPQPNVGYPQTAARYAPTGTQYPHYPSYSSLAQQSSEPMPEPAEPAPVPPSEGPAKNGATMNGTANGHIMNGGTAADNGANGYMQNGGVNGYPMGNDCGTECNSGYSDHGLSGYFDNPCYDSQWFGGVYFLWMERDNASPVKLTVEVDHTVATDPYYPQANTSVVTTHQTDFDFREGVEVRFGSTFSVGGACDTGCSSGCGSGYGYGYNGCGGNACALTCPEVFAWEVAWWGIDDDAQASYYVDNVPTVADQTRIYGMKNFAGLEYDRDAGGTWDYLPVNDFYGYGLPIDAPPGAAPDDYVVVIAQRVRQNFNAQNLELNLIRFPMCAASCGGCNSGCGGSECGDGGCASDCDTGCQTDCCPSAFSMYGSCGVRYFRADDDFMYANEFGQYTAGTIDQGAYNGFTYDNSNELFYTIDIENHLAGAQLGWSMNYCYACKWNFFANSNFGLYNNHINHYQRLYSGGDGTVRFAQTGESFRVRSDKDDIAFLGELRLGGSYDITCNWRAVAAYRAVAIAGLATSTDQIPDEFTNAEYVGIIDSDNSMIVHGLQVGAECRY